LEPGGQEGDDVCDGVQALLPVVGIGVRCRVRVCIGAGVFPRWAPSAVGAWVCGRASRVAVKERANMATATWWWNAVQVRTWWGSRPIRSLPCSLRSSMRQRVPATATIAFVPVVCGVWARK
jgi:hypothetical protein